MGLEREKTTCELPNCFEEQRENFSSQICLIYSDDVASACFSKGHLDLEMEDLNFYALITIKPEKLRDFRPAMHSQASLSRSHVKGIVLHVL